MLDIGADIDASRGQAEGKPRAGSGMRTEVTKLAAARTTKGLAVSALHTQPHVGITASY